MQPPARARPAVVYFIEPRPENFFFQRRIARYPKKGLGPRRRPPPKSFRGSRFSAATRRKQKLENYLRQHFAGRVRRPEKAGASPAFGPGASPDLFQGTAARAYHVRISVDPEREGGKKKKSRLVGWGEKADRAIPSPQLFHRLASYWPEGLPRLAGPVPVRNGRKKNEPGQVTYKQFPTKWISSSSASGAAGGVLANRKTIQPTVSRVVVSNKAQYLENKISRTTKLKSSSKACSPPRVKSIRHFPQDGPRKPPGNRQAVLLAVCGSRQQVHSPPTLAFPEIDFKKHQQGRAILPAPTFCRMARFPMADLEPYYTKGRGGNRSRLPGPLVEPSIRPRLQSPIHGPPLGR